ncbi:MAG TPA: FHA domain-containing protein, partial [Pyrinomonadaceae bacterium]|nr:FHA domain-containing protein [Pyrinomonadaceae bacterium]
MPPRLAAISGKHKGAIFALNEEPLVIGRDTSAHLSVADASVSRRHSRIEKKDDGFVITDLESLNGTFVNDVPVKSRLLEHGDRVRIGDSQFLFLEHEGDSMSKSSDVRIEETQVVSGSTVQIRFDHAIYLMGRDLSALMKVSTTINSIRGLDDLLERLLELLFEVVPAQRGAILLVNEGSFETSLVFGLHRTHGKNRAITVSRTIVQQVLRDGVALLANDGVSEWTAATDSLISTGAQSVMCVPLLLFDRKLGVLYLDTT